MSYNNNTSKLGEQFPIGACIGVVGMGLSTLSQELFNVKLGYDRFGFKNVFKVVISSGLTTMVVIKTADAIYEKMDK